MSIFSMVLDLYQWGSIVNIAINGVNRDRFVSICSATAALFMIAW